MGKIAEKNRCNKMKTGIISFHQVIALRKSGYLAGE
jgi:hypothetical protein